MNESGLACDTSGNLSKPTNPPPGTASSTTTSTTAANKRTKQQHSNQLLLLEAEAAKRGKLVTVNENVDQLRADREAAVRQQLDDEDRAFTLPHIRGALPSESIAFLKWKGGRDGQSMWQAWMAGLTELSECRRQYRTLKRSMTTQREQLLQWRGSEEERTAVRRANDDGVEVMDEDEYERYMGLLRAQKVYMADEVSRLAARRQLDDCLSRMSELQADMCESFIGWYGEKYAGGQPRKAVVEDGERKQRWWEVRTAGGVEEKAKAKLEEEQKVSEESSGEVKVSDVVAEDRSGTMTDVQLNLSDVSGSKPGSSASQQKKDTVTSRSKVSRNTTSRT